MKNVLFDCYGTLVDIETEEESEAFWARVSRHCERATKERYRSLCAERASRLPVGAEIDLLSVFAAMTGMTGEALLAFARAFRAASYRRLRLFPYAAELTDALRARGAGVFLLSNAQACFTREELRRLGLDRRFDGILLSSEAGWKKPSPELFFAAFERFGLSARDCVYVGNDLRDDVGGAHGVGMRCLYLETEQSGQYADPPVPDWRARDLQEALSLLSAQLCL